MDGARRITVLYFAAVRERPPPARVKGELAEHRLPRDFDLAQVVHCHRMTRAREPCGDRRAHHAQPDEADSHHPRSS